MTPTPDKSARALMLAAALALAAFACYLSRGLPVGIPGQWEWRYHHLPVTLLPAMSSPCGLCPPAWFLLRLPWKDLPRGYIAPSGSLCSCSLVFGSKSRCSARTAIPGWSPATSSPAPAPPPTSRRPSRFRTSAGGCRLPGPPATPLSITRPPILPAPCSTSSRSAAPAAHFVPADSPFWSDVAKAYDRFGFGPQPSDAAGRGLGRASLRAPRRARESSRSMR